MTQEELGLTTLLNYLTAHSDFYTRELLHMAEYLREQEKNEVYAEILSGVQMLIDSTVQLKQARQHLESEECTCEKTA